jgi:hypothetical protein
LLRESLFKSGEFVLKIGEFISVFSKEFFLKGTKGVACKIQLEPSQIQCKGIIILVSLLVGLFILLDSSSRAIYLSAIISLLIFLRPYFLL